MRSPSDIRARCGGCEEGGGHKLNNTIVHVADQSRSLVVASRWVSGWARIADSGERRAESEKVWWLSSQRPVGTALAYLHGKDVASHTTKRFLGDKKRKVSGIKMPGEGTPGNVWHSKGRGIRLAMS